MAFILASSAGISMPMQVLRFCRTVSKGYRVYSWCSMPMYGVARPLPATPSFDMSTHSSPMRTSTVPPVAGVWPAIMREVVVLPAPDTPMMPKTSLSPTSNVTPSTAFTTPLTTEK